MRRKDIRNYIVVLACVIGALASPALAYIGPGSGLSAIGAFLAAVVGLIVAIFGFVWYPIKRLRRRFRKPEQQDVDETGE